MGATKEKRRDILLLAITLSDRFVDGATSPDCDNGPERYAILVLREIAQGDLGELGWTDAGEDGYRINAELTCSRCGAYQAADSDPSFNKARPVALVLRLFNAVGWRADGDVGPVCPACVAAAEGQEST